MRTKTWMLRGGITSRCLCPMSGQLDLKPTVPVIAEIRSMYPRTDCDMTNRVVKTSRQGKLHGKIEIFSRPLVLTTGTASVRRFYGFILRTRSRGNLACPGVASRRNVGSIDKLSQTLAAE